MTLADSDAPVTVLVTDIEGSTDLQSRLGDVKARDLVRLHETVVRRELASHGGREIKTMGDGFLATFTSTRRALECAIAIQCEASELRVRMGLHAGEVIEEDNDIHGAAISAAARIMGHARGGEIVVSDLIRQLAGAAGIGFTERGRVTLKGLDGQWLLYTVESGAVTTAAPAPAAPSSALIGREAETATLRNAVRDAANGRGRLVLVAGEPGIGKTTLATDAVAYGTSLGALALWGSCWEGEGPPAFWPWIQAVRAYAAEQADEDLAALAGASAAELCRLMPELATRLPAGPEPPELAPEQARFRLFDAIASFLQRAAARRPLLLVLDDLHWADESSMRLLGFVAAQLATSAIAVIGTYRDTEVGPDHPLAAQLHEASRRGQVLPITGLDATDVAALMATTAGAELSAQLTAAVHEQTAGNPLFVGEVTRLLAAQNALDRSEVAIGVPQGVREVIERRMVRLPQRCIEVLTLAAVAGEEFRLDVVARAAELSVPALVEILEPAVIAGAAHATTMGRYRFAHALFREALYEGQGTVARGGLHLQIANALEDRDAETGDVDTAELAHHFSLAALTGDTERAVKYARAAATEASAALAYEEAVRHLERALQTLDLAPHPTESDRAEILLDLSGARWRAGDRNGATAEVDRSIALARRTKRGDVLARAALGLHRLGGISGVADSDSMRLLEEALNALEDDETPLRARVMAALAKERYHSWLHLPESQTGEAMAEEAVAMAKRLGDKPVLAEALLAHHDLVWFPGHEHQRLDIATELERTAHEIGNRELAAEAVLLQAVALLELGEAGALSRLAQFIDRAEKLLNPRFAYLAATRRATLGMITGDVPAIEAALAAAAVVAAEHGEPDHNNVSAAQMYTLGTITRNRSAAVARSREAYEFNKSYVELIEATTCLAAIDDGDMEFARQHFRLIDIASLRTRFRNYGWLYQAAVLAEAAAELGETDVMAQLSEQLEPYADRCIVVAGAVNFLGSASHYLALMAQALGRTADADRFFDQAQETYTRMGATFWAQRAREARAAGSGASVAAADNEFRVDGTTWTVRYEGATFTVRDSKGVRDLAVLLAQPGKDVAAADLMAHGEVVAAGADAVLDDQARRQFRARLAELDEDLAEADAANDLERISRIKAERDALAHELAAALGLGGRNRKLGDPAERARKAVAARLRDAIEKISTQHAELGQHLRASVRTGTFCSYVPPSPTVWRVTDSTPR